MKSLSAHDGRRLQQERQRRGLSRACLAREWAISATTLRRWEEGGVTSLSDEAWAKVARFLNTGLAPRLQRLQALHALLPSALQKKLERQMAEKILAALNETAAPAR